MTPKFRLGCIGLKPITNLSTISSFYYHFMMELRTSETTQEDQKAMPGEQRTQNPDTSRLNKLVIEVGNNHRELKQVTTTFYLNMKRSILPSNKQIFTLFFS